MRITIEYSAQIKQAAGRADEVIDLEDGTTVDGAIRAIAARPEPALGGILLDDAGRPLPSLLAFVSDRQVPPGSADALRDGDRLTLMSPISGG